MSSSSSSSSLPTPRQLLTSILNAISEIPPPPPPSFAQAGAPTGTTETSGSRANPPPSNNPLKRLNPSHRPLFTTLHVLFPSLLLPALDLLDRRLVTRVAPAAAPTAPHPAQQREDLGLEMDTTTTAAGAAAAVQTTSPTTQGGVYVVRSAQKKTTSGGGGGGGGGGSRPLFDSAAAVAGQTTSYIVHTAPWSCTCAAFAFAAFPPVASSASFPAARTDDEAEVNDDGDGSDDDGGRWGGFGGLSSDGVGQNEAGIPPCCKHLLACVLAERWLALGGYVNERTVKREELAGIFAGI